MPSSRADIPAVPLVRTDEGEPTVSDRYELRSVLGSGGMGTVWEAYDRRLGRTVALKVLRDDLPPSAAARLEREARAAARIHDPRVVTVLDLDRTRDGTPYLVLECHDGATLADELRAGGALSADRLDQLIDDLLGALAAAHECGVLHRDVKPANVLAGTQGFRVTDFGLASLDDDQTTETDLMGTLVYVAPERLEGARGTTRSDVFSAAVVLYEAASGVQPFRADEPAESIARLRSGDAPPLPDHLPLALRTALHRALSADPAARPADARELLQAVRGGMPPEPTVVLDATAVLPPAGPDDPTEDVFGRGRSSEVHPVPEDAAPGPGTSVFPTAPAAEPEPRGRAVEPTVTVPPAERTVAVPQPAVRTTDRPAPPELRRAPQASAGERVSSFLSLARRRPEVAVAAAGALLVLLLVLAELLTPDGGADPAPAADAPVQVQEPTSLDGVLDRIEEIGR